MLQTAYRAVLRISESIELCGAPHSLSAMKLSLHDLLTGSHPDHSTKAHSPAALRACIINSKNNSRRLSLALQGGGSFGAFTWGVLDRLLEEDGLVLDAVSGASAGAVNAVLLASGLSEGGRTGAQQRLERFWKRASDTAPIAHSGPALAIATSVLSPYQFNPFNLNPLKSLLASEIDFDALRNKPSVRLLIGATRVRDGKLHIFVRRISRSMRFWHPPACRLFIMPSLLMERHTGMAGTRRTRR